MKASAQGRPFSPAGYRKSRNDELAEDSNIMSMGDKRRHKRNILSNGRDNSRMKKKLTRVEILPELPKSPEEKTRPIIQPKKELKIHEELQKGSEMLRKEAALNLQKYGGNFMPDFYGAKNRVNFVSKPGNENHSNYEIGNMFSSQNKNKWGLLVEYVTGKANNTEIIKNIIDERNHHKVKSLEDCNIQKPK